MVVYYIVCTWRVMYVHLVHSRHTGSLVALSRLCLGVRLFDPLSSIGDVIYVMCTDGRRVDHRFSVL